MHITKMMLKEEMINFTGSYRNIQIQIEPDKKGLSGWKGTKATLDPFTAQVIQIIQSIPEGHVMTYGKVAAAAGNSKNARQVSWILHSMSHKHRLPWHRIINAQGKISLTGSEQQDLLELEGVTFDEKGKVDLRIYEWKNF